MSLAFKHLLVKKAQDPRKTPIPTMTLNDVDRVATRALEEGNGEGKTFSIMDVGYPCPKTMTMMDMDKVCRSIVDMEKSNVSKM